jgi:hypothetical protein
MDSKKVRDDKKDNNNDSKSQAKLYITRGFSAIGGNVLKNPESNQMAQTLARSYLLSH